jgi:hypothetical protein
MMNKRIRFTLLALVATVVLAGAGNALAAYAPTFVASSDSQQLSGGGGTGMTFRVSVPRDDDATAKVTIYVPQGYGGILDRAPGTNLGSVTAQVIAKALGGALLPLTGSVIAADPNAPASVNNPCAPGVHAAVWNLVLTAAGQTLNVPVYLDTITQGPEVSFAKFKMQICLPSPDVPADQGGATFGAKLIFAQFSVKGVFNNPTARGENVFRGLFTPYVAGSGTVNPLGTVEARSTTRLPAQLSLAAVVNQRTGVVTIRGTLSEFNVGLAGQKIKLRLGTTARGVKIIRTLTTNAKGNYAATLRLKKGQTRYLRTDVFVPVRDNTATGCAGTSLAPAGCTSATLPSFTLASLRVIKISRRR